MIRWCDDPGVQGEICGDHLSRTHRSEGFPADIANVARRKLVMVNNAGMLADLKLPLGNRLEALQGKLAGKHSVRINDQWRVVFRWTENGPDEVEIVDYH